MKLLMPKSPKLNRIGNNNNLAKIKSHLYSVELFKISEEGLHKGFLTTIPTQWS
jgi:hypothetical protein